MKIVFVGAGRLATNLARALHAKGHSIEAIYSRTLASATALTTIVGGRATDVIDELPLQADAFIIAVKDAVLADVIARLVQGREDQHFFHTAGSVPLSVFDGYAEKCGVIYPMQTFSKEREVDFVRVPIYIEASCDDTLQLAERIASAVSADVHQLSSEARRYLHLAAVFACNFVNHCYALSEKVLQRYDIPFEVMLPLIEETAEKVRTMAPRDAQTGPAVRYDENVIHAQEQLLADDPELREIYTLMSKSINRLAND